MFLIIYNFVFRLGYCGLRNSYLSPDMVHLQRRPSFRCYLPTCANRSSCYYGIYNSWWSVILWRVMFIFIFTIQYNSLFLLTSYVNRIVYFTSKYPCGILPPDTAYILPAKFSSAESWGQFSLWLVSTQFYGVKVRKPGWKTFIRKIHWQSIFLILRRDKPKNVLLVWQTSLDQTVQIYHFCLMSKILEVYTCKSKYQYLSIIQLIKI